MVFYPGDTLNNDPSNHWGPNIECVKSMLMEVGFKRLAVYGAWHPTRCVVHAYVDG
jgi:hypothetical protein